MEALSSAISDMVYKLYRYVIVVVHFVNELKLDEFTFGSQSSSLERVEQIIFSNRFSTFKFQAGATETSNITDDEFLNAVEKAKQHCYRGDVFQMVLSRRFTKPFNVEEFNVYCSLLSLNTSLYL